MTQINDRFGSFASLLVGGQTYGYSRLAALDEQGLCRLARLPYSIRILLEATLRHCDGFEVTEEDVRQLAGWTPENAKKGIEIPFKPARVILQDFTRGSGGR